MWTDKHTLFVAGLVGWLLFFGFFLEVQGASVTLANSVVVSNGYGRLTVVGSNQVDSLTTYPNGTIFFNVATSYLSQLVYTFTAQSYGNGTFTVRLRGPAPASVQTGGHLATIISGNQDVVYSGGDGGYGGTGVLVISYRGVSHLIRDASLVMAMMVPIVLAIGLARWSQDPFDPNRAEKMEKLYYAGLIMSLATVTLFILSQLFE